MILVKVYVDSECDWMILVKVYVTTFKTDVIGFIGKVIICLTSH